jgi:hypothetical protein
MKRRDRAAAAEAEAINRLDSPKTEEVRPVCPPDVEDELLALTECQWAVKDVGGALRLTTAPADAALILPVSAASAGLRNRRVWWVF